MSTSFGENTDQKLRPQNKVQDLIERAKPFMDVPEICASIERLYEYKRKFQEAREVIRSLGGDVVSDNPFLNEP